MIQILQKRCEERRAELLALLNNANTPLEYQHQLYGGIKELDNVIGLAAKYRNQTANKLLDKDEYRLRKEWREGYFTRFKRTLRH